MEGDFRLEIRVSSDLETFYGRRLSRGVVLLWQPHRPVIDVLLPDQQLAVRLFAILVRLFLRTGKGRFGLRNSVTGHLEGDYYCGWTVVPRNIAATAVFYGAMAPRLFSCHDFP